MKSEWLHAMVFRGLCCLGPTLVATLFVLSFAFTPTSSSEERHLLSLHEQQPQHLLQSVAAAAAAPLAAAVPEGVPARADGSGLLRLLKSGSAGDRSFHKRMRWSFAWGSGTDGTCRCKEVSWGEFKTEDECLRDYASSSLHSCTYHGYGVLETDCKHAVSVDPAIYNSECVAQCLESVDKEGYANLSEIFRFRCSIEKYEVSSGQVFSMSKCFTNEIHGHSDTSLALPIPDVQMNVGQVGDVATATECQELCQKDPLCSSWLWRKVYDPKGMAPNTCFFKNVEMVKEAVVASIPVGRFSNAEAINYEEPAWQFCDLEGKWNEVRESYSPDTEVCNCGCVWRSTAHLSGPKFCQAVVDGSRDHWGAGPPSLVSV